MNILFRFLPIIMLCVLNIFIICVMKKTYMRRHSLSSTSSSPRSSAEQVHLTVMLLTITFLFVFCILPGAVSSVVSHLWTDYSRLGAAKNLFECVSNVTYFLETLNSSINFVIYMALSKRFCVTYKKIFCCGQKNRYLSNGSYNSSYNKDKRKDSNGRKTPIKSTSNQSCESKNSLNHHQNVTVNLMLDYISTNQEDNTNYNTFEP